MIEIRKTAVPLEEPELIELERVIIDADADQALKFLERVVYNKIVRSQGGYLKSHLDTGNDPTQGYSCQR